MRWPLLFALLSLGAPAQRQNDDPVCHCPNAEAGAAHTAGVAAHRQRRLNEASAGYTRALQLTPSRDPSSAERELILKFAPRIFTPDNEPLALKDAAAIMHPDRPWIAYHLFWEDDIDFPDDNDPCDHELLWIELDERRERVRNVYTYFHGRILRASDLDLEQAYRSGGRARVAVQWGKHGSMPWNWKSAPIQADRGDGEYRGGAPANAITLEEYNRRTWAKLSQQGRDAQQSPLARGWPLKFQGSWEDFSTFSKEADLRGLLTKRGYIKVSFWNNAVINRQFLVYNFSAKTEWPDAICLSTK